MLRKSGRIDRGKCGNGSNIIKDYFFQKKTVLKTLMLCMPIFIMLSGASFALAETSVEKDENRLQSKHNFEIGPVFNYFEYKEPDIDVDLTGYMAGAMGKYTFSTSQGFIFSAELEYTYGLDIEYDGYIGAMPVNEDSKDWIVEPRIIIGGRLKINKHSTINPYIGLGYRYWYDDVEGAGSYKRKTEYYYLPVGTNFSYDVSENFKWGVNLEFDVFLWGRNRSNLSDADPGYNDVTLDQDSGYGLRASIPFTFKSVQIEPYIYYWDIDESDSEPLTYYGAPTIYEVYEPDNKTTVYGIKLTFLF